MCVLPGSPEDLAAHHVIDDLTAALERGETSTDAYFRRAVAHKQTFHLHAAIDDFSAVIRRAPRADLQLGRSHFLRSICNRRTGRIAEAIDDGDAAVALRPDDSHVWTVRGFALAQAGRLEDAEHDLEQAITLDPDNWLAEVYRGFNRFAAHDYRAAIEAYDRAMSLTDGWVSFGPYLNRGITRLVLGDRDEARNDIVHAARLRPQMRLIATDPRPHAYLALVHYLDGDYGLAHEQVHEAEHLGPDPMAALVHGLLEAREGDRTHVQSLLAEMTAWHPGGSVAGVRDAARFLDDPVSIVPLLQPLTR